MFCPYCGKKIIKTYKYCPYCGKSISDVFKHETKNTKKTSGEKERSSFYESLFNYDKKLAAKNLYNKLVANRESLLVVDWYKDDLTKSRVKEAISDSLDNSYDKEVFVSKTNLLLSVFVDKAVQGIVIV